jgi:tetratricopeptide (TPR) repeat protein
MARKTKNIKKTSDFIEKPQSKTPEKHEIHEIFTAKRLIIFFAVIEILIIALMFPTFYGRWHMNTAKKALSEGNYDKAYKHYMWLEKNSPAEESATFNLEMANTCYKLNKYDDAIKYSEILIKKTEGQKGSYRLLGMIYFDNGKLASARAAFLKELEKNPTDPDSNFHLGTLAFDEKKFTDATNYFSRVAFIPSYKNKLKPYWKTIEKEVLEKE